MATIIVAFGGRISGRSGGSVSIAAFIVAERISGTIGLAIHGVAFFRRHVAQPFAGIIHAAVEIILGSIVHGIGARIGVAVSAFIVAERISGTIGLTIHGVAFFSCHVAEPFAGISLAAVKIVFDAVSRSSTWISVAIAALVITESIE